MADVKYKCPECEWVGTESEMRADYYWIYSDPDTCEHPIDEVWSSTICPQCNDWHNNDLREYDILKEE